jgi:hypothetical protein
VLAVAGSGMSFAIKSFGVYLNKEPLPLKKSLELLDENDLSPYVVVPPKLKIENEEVLESLGTEDYIQWILEDTNVEADSSVKKCMLFITYYRLPDRVPHVPEECYAGGGFQRLASDGVKFKINNDVGFEKSIEGKYLVFGSTNANLWRSTDKFPVLYLFRVNGEYAGSREQARAILNKNLFKKNSYFSKVEIVFNQGPDVPDKKNAVDASQKLLTVILPILEQEFWPDW